MSFVLFLVLWLNFVCILKVTIHMCFSLNSLNNHKSKCHPFLEISKLRRCVRLSQLPKLVLIGSGGIIQIRNRFSISKAHDLGFGLFFHTSSTNKMERSYKLQPKSSYWRLPPSYWTLKIVVWWKESINSANWCWPPGLHGWCDLTA